jgi:hypothetical protein
MLHVEHVERMRDMINTNIIIVEKLIRREIIGRPDGSRNDYITLDITEVRM